MCIDLFPETMSNSSSIRFQCIKHATAQPRRKLVLVRRVAASRQSLGSFFRVWQHSPKLEISPFLNENNDIAPRSVPTSITGQDALEITYSERNVVNTTNRILKTLTRILQRYSDQLRIDRPVGFRRPFCLTIELAMLVRKRRTPLWWNTEESKRLEPRKPGADRITTGRVYCVAMRSNVSGWDVHSSDMLVLFLFTSRKWNRSAPFK